MASLRDVDLHSCLSLVPSTQFSRVLSQLEEANSGASLGPWSNTASHSEQGPPTPRSGQEEANVGKKEMTPPALHRNSPHPSPGPRGHRVLTGISPKEPLWLALESKCATTRSEGRTETQCSAAAPAPARSCHMHRPWQQLPGTCSKSALEPGRALQALCDSGGPRRGPQLFPILLPCDAEDKELGDPMP